MGEPKSKTVAAISFNDNRSLSIDVEAVSQIQVSPPMEAGEEGLWFTEVIVRSDNGIVSLQLLSDDPDKLRFPAE